MTMVMIGIPPDMRRNRGYVYRQWISIEVKYSYSKHGV